MPNKKDTVIVAKYNRLKAEWKFKEDRADKYEEAIKLINIAEFNSKGELLKRVQASTELRRIIDHLSIGWIDFYDIKDVIGMNIEDIQRLYGTDEAFRYDSLFYIEKARLLLEAYADKEDGRFNSKEMKRNLRLIYTWKEVISWRKKWSIREWNTL